MADEEVAEEKTEEIAGRPEYIPEKYWDAASGRARVEDLGKGYIELSSTLGKREETSREEITAEIKADMRKDVPEEAADYIYKPGEDIIPKGTEFKMDSNNPQLIAFGEMAHDIGLSQTQYDSVVDLYVKNELAMMPDQKAEAAKLGENGKARIERVDLWAKSNLTEGAYNAIVRQATSGEFILAMEELIDKTGSGVDMEGAGDGQAHGPLSRQELETMMKDPRYRDVQKRDPVFVQRVEAGFAALK
jgi:hypothetical protein